MAGSSNDVRPSDREPGPLDDQRNQVDSGPRDNSLSRRVNGEVRHLSEKIRGAMGLPEELDPFSEKNIPKRGSPSTFRRFFRIVSLWILAVSLVASFIYSMFVAAKFFELNVLILQFQELFLSDTFVTLQDIISFVLSGFTLSGLLFLAIDSETKDRSFEIKALVAEKKEKMMEIGLTEEQVKLVAEEFMPDPQRRKRSKFKIFFFVLAIGCLGAYGVLFFSTGEMYHALAIYGLVGAVITVGFLLSGFAGELNVELWQFHLFGLHVHECAIGIFFIIVAVPLMYHGAVPDKILAAFYFFMGAFLIGRDWKDMSAGKVIERLGRY